MVRRIVNPRSALFLRSGALKSTALAKLAPSGNTRTSAHAWPCSRGFRSVASSSACGRPLMKKTATPRAFARLTRASVGASAFACPEACQARSPHGPVSRLHSPATTRPHPFALYAGQLDNEVSSISSTIAGRAACVARCSTYACACATTFAKSASYRPDVMYCSTWRCASNRLATGGVERADPHPAAAETSAASTTPKCRRFIGLTLRQDLGVEQIHLCERTLLCQHDVPESAFRHPAIGFNGVAADVRREDDVRQRAKVTASVRRFVRLAREDVERGAGEPAFGQRREQGCLVDEGAARRVDQPAALTQARQSFAVEPVQVFTARRQVETHEVGIAH